jgi:hypothetical protein
MKVSSSSAGIRANSNAAESRGCFSRSSRRDMAQPHALVGGHRIPVMRSHLMTLDCGVMDPAPALYTIRIKGYLGATMLSAFPALAPRRHGEHTVLIGLLDRSALHGVLAQMEALGLDLLEVRRHMPERESPKSGDSGSP